MFPELLHTILFSHFSPINTQLTVHAPDHELQALHPLGVLHLGQHFVEGGGGDLLDARLPGGVGGRKLLQVQQQVRLAVQQLPVHGSSSSSSGVLRPEQQETQQQDWVKCRQRQEQRTEACQGWAQVNPSGSSHM